MRLHIARNSKPIDSGLLRSRLAMIDCQDGIENMSNATRETDADGVLWLVEPMLGDGGAVDGWSYLQAPLEPSSPRRLEQPPRTPSPPAE